MSGRRGLRIHSRVAVLVSIRRKLPVAYDSGMHSGMPSQFIDFSKLAAVLRIRIHRIHMFLGLLDPDPDPSVRRMDPQHWKNL